MVVVGRAITREGNRGIGVCLGEGKGHCINRVRYGRENRTLISGSLISDADPGQRD
jgi:hypothetical protein